MIDTEYLDQIKKWIIANFKKRDLRPLEDEEFDADGWSGGSFDDAFQIGVDAGYALALDDIKGILGMDNDDE